MSGRAKPEPAILFPNPFYPAYAAGTDAAGCKRVMLATTPDNGFLPDLEALDEATLSRTVALFLASPPIRRARWPRRLISSA